MAPTLARVVIAHTSDSTSDDLARLVPGPAAPAALYDPEAWRGAVRRQLLGATLSRGERLPVWIGSRRVYLDVVDTAPVAELPDGHAGTPETGAVGAETRIEFSSCRAASGAPAVPVPAGYDAETLALAGEVQGYFDSRDLYQQLRVQAPQTVLVHGVSGVGKSTVIACGLERLACPVVRGDLAEIVASASGADIADEYVAMALADIAARAGAATPSVIVLDALDVLCDDEEQTDGIASLGRHFVEFTERLPPGVALVLESCTDGAGLPPSVRRCEALQHKLPVPVPRLTQREAIVRSTLRELLAGTPGAPAPDMDSSAAAELVARVANAAAGYVAREIAAVCRQALLRRLRAQADGDLAQQLQRLCLAEDAPALPEWPHFAAALQIVRPSQQLEFESPRPTLRWADIGGYVRIKQELQQFIRLATSETPSRLGIRPPSGILLHGPPGCGKTTLALAMIGESACNVISIRGSELFSKYLGESEARLRRLFQAARAAAPCIVFMDEVDSIAARREWSSVESGSPALRVLSTLLNEMDGVHESRGVVAVGCTNQLDKIDDAILRPGRFDRLVEVPLPSADDRAGILQVLAQRAPLADDVCVTTLAEMTDAFSGADVERLFREAGLAAMRADPAAAVLAKRDFVSGIAAMQDGRL